MNRICSLLTLCVVLLLARPLAAQTIPPTVPAQLDFAGILVRLDPDARRIMQQDINALLSNQRYWQAKLDRVVLYFPIIEAALAAEDVPVDFKYLAVQESSLSPDAVSASSAVGYWQFKAQTAIDQGLRVDEEIDERKSITASTRGAARYLKRSNIQFNNWVSSLYSFYLGAGGISKLVPTDWAYAREITLGQATDRYILRFFAHKIALENALNAYRPANPVTLLEYADSGNKTLGQIATELNIDLAELLIYNRWLLTDAPIPADKPYSVAVPVQANRINEVRQKVTRVGNTAPPRASVADATLADVGFPVLRKITLGVSSKSEPILFEINGLPGIQAQPGDDALGLARKAKISMASFLRYNDMDELDRVVPMDIYYLSKKRKKALVPFHTVREDETAYSIAQRYGIRLRKLMRYNRLDRVQKLATGRVMWLRERRPANKPVEIINAPTLPTYDRNSPVPTDRPAPVRPVAGSETVPRTPAERVLYQPKLADAPANPAPRPTSTYPDPSTVRRPEPEPTNEPSLPPAGRPTPTEPVTTPAPVRPASDRVVVVRPADVPVTPAPSTGSRPPVSASEPRPVPASVIKAPSPVPPRAAAVGGRTMKHAVQPGQTYYSISKLYGVTIANLLEANSLTETDVLAAGQMLVIRNVPAGFPLGQEVLPTTPTTKPAQTGLTIFHVVEKGETMFRISKLYEVSIEQIQQWNQLPDATVKIGQRLRIVKQ